MILMVTFLFGSSLRLLVLFWIKLLLVLFSENQLILFIFNVKNSFFIYLFLFLFLYLFLYLFLFFLFYFFIFILIFSIIFFIYFYFFIFFYFYFHFNHFFFFSAKEDDSDPFMPKKRMWVWEGSKTKTKLKYAMKSIEQLQNKYGDPPLLPLKEGFEPPHLLSLFGGCFVVNDGDDDLLFDSSSFNTKIYSLFEISGHRDCDTTVLQCPRSHFALKSSCVYVLHSPQKNWVWRGNQAKNFIKRISSR